MRCKHCDNPTQGSTGYCRSCKFWRRRLFKHARTHGWLVDMAGGGWWVWDRIGNVLGMGNSAFEALIDAQGATT